MKYLLFACDLDNTLIHSYKHRHGDDICIEHYNGREQSFISSHAVELLKEINKKVVFIPVTTRFIEQYTRIKWLEGTNPIHAVVSNGANLIIKNSIDIDWQLEYYNKYIQSYRDELQYQCEILSNDKNFDICRIVDDSFLFLKCSDEINVEEISRELQYNTNLTVQYFGRKIYLFPQKLNKGEALRQLIKKFSPTCIFCAGDSPIDVPMLDIADISYVKSPLISKLNHSRYIEFNSAEDILKNIINQI